MLLNVQLHVRRSTLKQIVRLHRHDQFIDLVIYDLDTALRPD
jgi:hypothetical protein